jgi:hypothetical protein
MTRAATPTPSLARTRPARHPSPEPRANPVCSPATAATAASTTPATCGPSPPWVAPPVEGDGLEPPFAVETAVHLEVDVIDAVTGDEVVVGLCGPVDAEAGQQCPPTAAKPQVSGRFWAPDWGFLAGTPNGVRTRVSTLRGRQCSCAEACPSHPAWSSGRARRLQTHCVLWDAGGASGHVDLAARQARLPLPSVLCPTRLPGASVGCHQPATCTEGVRRTSLSPVPMAQIADSGALDCDRTASADLRPRASGGCVVDVVMGGWATTERDTEPSDLARQSATHVPAAAFETQNVLGSGPPGGRLSVSFLASAATAGSSLPPAMWESGP